MIKNFKSNSRVCLTSDFSKRATIVPRKRKKGKNKAHNKNGHSAKEGIFNPAFRDLGKLKKTVTETAGKTENVVQESKEIALSDDDRLFAEAMNDVSPISKKNRKVAKVPDKDALRPAHSPRNDDLEVMAHLSDLISGAAEMDITFSDEYMEGAVKGFDPKLMDKLRNGLFPIQDYVDLHRLTQEAAEMRVRDFLLNSHGKGLRCVLIVHGKGLNSENHIPVLKKSVPIWLSRGPVRKIILAFSTARPYDGGTGAIYVLLKRAKGGF